MATDDWHYEKDAYGDDSWDRTINGIYYELRIYPTTHNWGLFLINFGSGHDKGKKRKLKEGTKEEVTVFAKKYISKH